MLIGLLPLLALSSASAYVIDSPPPSPSLTFSATFSATLSPSLSPSLGSVPSPHFSSPTIPSPLSPSLASAATFSATATASASVNGGVGVVPTTQGKGLGTNAERLKRGLGPLPPTRRSSANKARRSANPAALAARPASGSGDDTSQVNSTNDGSDTNDGSSTQAQDTNDQTQGQSDAAAPDSPSTDTNDGTQNQSSEDNTTTATSPDTTGNADPTTDTGATGNTNPTTDTDTTGNTDPTTDNSDDDSSFNGGPNVLASRKRYSMRMRNPDDMSDMGPVTMPNSNAGTDLLSMDLSLPPLSILLPPSTPLTEPFEIVPNPTGDDGAFSGPRKVLGAIPRRRNAVRDGGDNGDLGSGSGNYANIGMAWPDASGLLHIYINAVAHPFLASLPNNSGDPAANPSVSQLLSRPNLPATSGDGTDPARLLDTSVTSDLFGSPQSAIWTFHPRSSRLLAHFVNGNGNTVPTYFVTGGSCQHTLCLTADVAAFRDTYGQDAKEVHVLATADL
ncbi:hypothetical protein CI109_104376 [Kwoniella shandongensis]|uniref:Uncharacterized protein n=1 Tax=Kwoniella shandongensis TaxID=1734106 RepID=A0A5M6BYV2_9TREE|nr:uncharacterized protein CI109_004226 [Kwoniella shandongensis]KAA5527410.1 hypothetical protein CI109_004226 [Kwoniella shandongensis]